MTEDSDRSRNPRGLANLDDDLKFRNEWRRFERIYSQRKVFFSSDVQQAAKSTSRLFVISRNNDPWEIFGLEYRRDYLRRVYEVSGLHFSALHSACVRGDMNEVSRLLARSRACSTLARDSSGRVALHHAVVGEHHSIVRLLMKQPDARLQLHARDNRGATALQYVFEKMHRVALKTCPGKYPARQAKHLRNANKRVQDLWKLADRMVRLVGQGLRRELLSLDLKARGDAWDAVKNADLKRLKNLIEMYPETSESLNILNWTLLHEACSSKLRKLRVLQFVLSLGTIEHACRDVSGSTPLHHAAMRGWLEACVLLLDEEASNRPLNSEQFVLAVDNRGRTALHACLLYARRKIGSNHGMRDDAIMTARFLARRCPESIQVIDHDGLTALHYAICCGDQSLVDLLIELGANLFHNVKTIDTRREYGERAAWAPCGSRFQRHHGQKSIIRRSEEVPVSANQSSVRIEAFKACERMKKVRAGEVEHPGITFPMETLWFLVRRKRQRVSEILDPLVSADNSSQSPTLKPGDEHPVSEVSAPVEDTFSDGSQDPRGLGCRRFGAECDSCSDLQAHFQKESQNLASVSISPLTLAVRCCRLEGKPPLPERIAIVRTLLLAGGVVDDGAINEALQSIWVPQLLLLVLNHSAQALSRKHVLDNFCSLRAPGATVHDCQMTLLRLFEEDPDLFSESMMPSMFMWQYFDVFERVLARQMVLHGNVRPVFCRINKDIAESFTGSRSRKLPPIETAHLYRVVAWMSTWPGCVEDLCITCVSQLLARPVNGERRSSVDRALNTAVCAISKCTKIDGFFVQWIEKAIDRGLTETVRALWRLSGASIDLATKLTIRSTWPLRWSTWLSSDTTAQLAEQLVRTILRHGSSAASDKTDDLSKALVVCLTLVCIYDVSLDVIEELLKQIKHARLEQTAIEALTSKRFGGLRALEWMVRNDRTQIAELLMRDLFRSRDQREQFWLHTASAVLVSSSAAVSRWGELLFAKWRSETTIDVRRRFVATKAVRIHTPSASIFDVIHLTLDDADNSYEWIKISGLTHQAARWNANVLMESLLQQVPVDSAFWTELATLRDAIDECTPVELCESLGHYKLAQIFREFTSDREGVASSFDLRQNGLLRTLIQSASERADRPETIRSPLHTSTLALLQGNWSAAVAMDDTLALEAFSLHRLAVSDDFPGLEQLIRTAICHGSFEALQWLLSAKNTLSVAPLRLSSELVLFAARHSSFVSAKITMRLLEEPDIDLGRLSGDGPDVTLLHRVACFSDATLAYSMLDSLLRKDNSEVDVRDGGGFTPVAYAIVSGNIATASFLVRVHGARLENEFEGQSVFYYTLQLLPSFSWRLLFQQLLYSTRNAAFLHCTSDDCACKSFESATTSDRALTPTDGQPVLPVCSFCGHSKETHTRVPYPPWFHDQYETYLDSSADDADKDSEEEPDDGDASSRRQRSAAPLADEAAVENARGRLDAQALTRLTTLRFRGVLEASALPLPVANDPENIEQRDAPVSGQSAGSLARGSCPNLAAPAAHARRASARAPSVPSAPGTSRERENEPPRAASDAMDLALLPWFLRADVAAAMRSDGHFKIPWNMTPHAVVHGAVVAWLLFAAENVLRPRMLSSSSVERAFGRWRDVTRSGATSTPTLALEGCAGRKGARRRPVALDFPGAPVGRRGIVGEQSVLASRPTLLASTPPSNLIGSGDANTRVSILHLFVHHWKYARVYQSFRQWKRSAVPTQLALHELETLAESWAAAARRERFHGLVARQRALENDLRSQGLLV